CDRPHLLAEVGHEHELVARLHATQRALLLVDFAAVIAAASVVADRAGPGLRRGGSAGCRHPRHNRQGQTECGKIPEIGRCQHYLLSRGAPPPLADAFPATLKTRCGRAWPQALFTLS